MTLQTEVTRPVRIIAVESSTRSGSIALCENDRLVAVRELPPDQRTAQWLAPTIEAALRQADWAPQSLGLVALTDGPGSFTGLRIAVTTAKAFAYAVSADVVALNTLDVIVHQLPVDQLPGDVTEVWTVMDAQREQLFAACYQRTADHRWESLQPCHLVDIATFADALPPGTTVSGPGLRRLASRLPQEIHQVDPSYWPPNAASVGHLAWIAFQSGQRDDLWKLAPQYYRPSYAEESA